MENLQPKSHYRQFHIQIQTVDKRLNLRQDNYSTPSLFPPSKYDDNNEMQHQKVESHVYWTVHHLDS